MDGIDAEADNDRPQRFLAEIAFQAGFGKKTELKGLEHAAPLCATNGSRGKNQP
jgi:hypothetical protein